jgi:predicted enzyme related to lactoylglutathione lyase
MHDDQRTSATGSFMPTHQGRFVWDELMTTDVEGAKKFYSALVPWKTKPWDDETSYTLIENAGVEIGGIATPSGEGRKVEWMPSVYVYDLDACIRQVPRIGGTVVRPPEEIPNMGCWSLIAGPDGARISIFEPADPPKPGNERAPGVGEFSWHELMSGDYKASWEFYRQLFGWEKIDEHQVDRLGTYFIFGRKGAATGGMFTRSAEMPPASWVCYLQCESVAKGVETVRANGGRVMREPSEVPGGSWIAQCTDPQGVMFALTSRSK